MQNLLGLIEDLRSQLFIKKDQRPPAPALSQRNPDNGHSRL